MRTPYTRRELCLLVMLIPVTVLGVLASVLDAPWLRLVGSTVMLFVILPLGWMSFVRRQTNRE